MSVAAGSVAGMNEIITQDENGAETVTDIATHLKEFHNYGNAIVTTRQWSESHLLRLHNREHIEDDDGTVEYHAHPIA